MIIKSLAGHEGDLELRWLNGIFSDFKRGLRIKALFHKSTGWSPPESAGSPALTNCLTTTGGTSWFTG